MDTSDLLYYGMMNQELSDDESQQFNLRWKRLCAIQEDLAGRFVDIILEQLNDKDNALLLPSVEEVISWQCDINERLDTAEDKHLTEYAMHLKDATLVALKLCKKYGVYNDIESFAYNAANETIELNGEVLYYLGA